jgi:hypothetical protein
MNSDNLFQLSENITCKNISELDNSKNIGVFAERTINCGAYGNENNKNYFLKHSPMDYLGYDQYIYNKCNPYSKAQFGINNSGLEDCNGFKCNDNVPYIKPHDYHSYRNGLKYNPNTNKYCTYHQIYHNLKGREEIPQHIEKGRCYVPLEDSMKGCKPIKALYKI